MAVLKETDVGEAVRRYHFTVAEYNRMGEAGVFANGPRVELLGGEVVEMCPMGSRHAACVDKIANFLVTLCGGAAIIRVQNPIVLDDASEHEPDISLLRRREDFYVSAHPEPDDILLTIEVAETSLQFDRRVKAPLYAAAGVPRLWIVDLDAGAIDIYEEPSAEGYRRVRRASPGERLALPLPSEPSFDVADVLP